MRMAREQSERDAKFVFLAANFIFSTVKITTGDIKTPSSLLSFFLMLHYIQTMHAREMTNRDKTHLYDALIG